MANSKSEFYVRNKRPNQIVFYYDGIRYALEARGSRGDSASLPAEAKSERTVSRWLQNGYLENISRESFTKLNARKIDVRPNTFLKPPMGAKGANEIKLVPGDGDATKSLTQIDPRQVTDRKQNTPNPEWAGELMTTEEELETFLTDIEESQSYPSRHRDSELREAYGY